MSRLPTPAILAVDGGNSKADVALVAGDGTLLAAVHGPSISHQAVGLERGMANLSASAARATRAAGAESGSESAPVADLAVYCLAGADYPSDLRALRRGIGALGLTPAVVVLNDTFGALRAGSSHPWGVVLICGRGINAAAVAPNGRSARFDAVGTYSGDWGGGMGVATEGLAAAVRGRDGRGPSTMLADRVPAYYGVRSPAALTKALYLGHIAHERLVELAPVVFQAAGDGDPIARSIIDRLADELAVMAGALIRRLRMTKVAPEVVLAGGVFRATDARFYARLESGIRGVAPHATFVRLAAPPVLGAALIGLDRLSPTGAADAEAEARLRAVLEAWQPTT